MLQDWRPEGGTLVTIEPVEALEAAGCVTGVVVDPSALGVGASSDAVVVDIGSATGGLGPKTDVVASFFSPEALHRAHAVCLVTDEQPHLVELDLRRVEHIERRGRRRCRVSLPCAMGAFDGPGDFSTVTGELVDVGTGGCRVRTHTVFPVGTDPTVVIAMPDEQPVVALAQVLESHRTAGDYEYRLLFMTIADRDVERLGALVET